MLGGWIRWWLGGSREGSIGMSSNNGLSREEIWCRGEVSLLCLVKSVNGGPHLEGTGRFKFDVAMAAVLAM
jgi:hypothetical protein